MGKKIGITDIARLSETSITAVSRVLGNKPNRYSEATVQRIREVAEQQGYMPNPYARSMRTGRYDTIAMIMSKGIGNSFLPMELHWGVDEGVRKHDLMLGMHYFDPGRLDDNAYLQQCLRSWRCDGVLINSLPKVPRKLIQFLNKMGVPYVVLNVRSAKDSVYINDVLSGRMATKHLIENGHEKITYFIGKDSNKDHYSYDERVKGYTETMGAAGLKPRFSEIPLDHAPVGMKAMVKVLSGRDRPTGIVSPGGLFADWAGVAAFKCGLKVPEDLSLVAIAEHPSNALGMVPDLVQLPFEQMGQEAVTLLTRRIAEKGESLPSLKLDPELVVHGMAVAQL